METEAFAEPAVATGEKAWTRWDTRRSVAAVAVVGAGAALARNGVPEPERDVLELINRLPDFLYPVVWGPMQLGSLAGGLAAAAALGVATKRLLVGVAGSGAVVSAWLGAKVIKDAVARPRPLEIFVDTIVRDGSRTGLGYVSGHTAVAFAIYTVAAPHLNRGWRAAALGLAVFVGLARIYVGAHLPLDVIGGAGVGMILGAVFRAAESVISKREGHDAAAG